MTAAKAEYIIVRIGVAYKSIACIFCPITSPGAKGFLFHIL